MRGSRAVASQLATADPTSVHAGQVRCTLCLRTWSEGAAAAHAADCAWEAARALAARPSLDEYMLEVAWAAARRSTCLRVPDGVGAVLTTPGGVVLGTGYAGSVRGAAHCVDVGCLLDSRGKCVRTVHAEVNALLQAARGPGGVAGAWLYSTMSPCWECFKVLANAGVSRVVFDVLYSDVQRQVEEAARAGVEWVRAGDAVFEPGRSS